MDPTNPITAGLILVGLLILSAFFSGSETAFFSLSKAALRVLRSREDAAARRVIRLVDRPRELLITILIGNTVVNVATASVAAITVHNLASSAGFNPTLALVLDILVVTFALIVISEISPKVFAHKNNEQWATSMAGLVQLCYYLFYPVMRIMVLFVDILAKVLGVESQRVLFSEGELRTLAEVGEEHGVLEEEEREMIHSIFEFGETEVQEIMVPRIDVASLAKTATVQEAAELVLEKGHSRIPVFATDMDHIVGILYAKDLIGKDHPEATIEELLRSPYFVPGAQKISVLLRKFQTEKIHMAIVVDEYGGTEGIVTMEDVIEEIVGEIQDEYDQEEDLFKRLDNGDILVYAKIENEEFNALIGEDLIPEEEDYETLGGFIFALAGEVPQVGQSYPYEGWVFIIEAVETNRVIRLRIRPPEDAAMQSEEEEEYRSEMHR